MSESSYDDTPREILELIAAIPLFVDHIPDRTIVVVPMEEAGDLLTPTGAFIEVPIDAWGVATATSLLTEHTEADVAFAVVCDWKASPPDQPGHVPADHRELISLLRHSLLRSGRRIALAESYAVAAPIPGAAWWSLDTPSMGILPDPTAEEPASDHDEADHAPSAPATPALTPDPDRQYEVAKLSATAMLEVIQRMQEARTTHRTEKQYVTTEFRWCVDQVNAHDPAAGPMPAALVAALGIRIGWKPVFARLLALTCQAASLPTIGSVWADMARSTQGAARGRAAALYALTAYLSGDTDTALAAIEVTRAQEPELGIGITIHLMFLEGATPEDFRAAIRAVAAALSD